MCSARVTKMDFNPRSPYGERPPCAPGVPSITLFQSTLPLRGATTFDLASTPSARFQSTLPLRGATSQVRGVKNDQFISIHAPLTGSDPVCSSIVRFKSDFNPRSPYGERQVYNTAKDRMPRISIHAPLTGSDRRLRPAECGIANFNPRSPYGERLIMGGLVLSKWLISIHAPLTGSDNCSAPCSFLLSDFNPRSPYGERPSKQHNS